MQIFTDLDGVLIDTSERSYSVYETILRKHGLPSLEKGVFLELKRQKVPLTELLARTGDQNLPESFKKEWLENIETAASLRHDRLFEHTVDTLQKLAARYALYLVTLRKKPELLVEELDRFGIKNMFTDILVGSEEGAGHESKIQKMEILAKPGDIMVGDSETDIRAGKGLGMITIAVENGWRSRELLEKESPDYFIGSISELLTLPVFSP